MMIIHKFRIFAEDGAFMRIEYMRFQGHESVAAGSAKQTIQHFEQIFV